MPAIETVRGPVEVAQLGQTLMHEHVFVLSEEIRRNSGNWDEEARVADAVAKLRALKSRGVDTIVDPTVIGLGRYIPRIARVNDQVDLHILVATGLYTFRDAPFYFQRRPPGKNPHDVDPMTAMFVRDIVEGIPGTNVKAAFLKCAIDVHGMTSDVKRVLRAVARAHVSTGAPITVHTRPQSQTGLAVQALFREEGVDLARVVVGHSGDSTDLDYLIALMEAGSFIGMDRFGIDTILPFEQRCATVAELCRRGYAERMVLAHDASCYIDWFEERTLAKALPRWHLTHIHDDVLPELRSRGVTDAQIATMLVENPRRYFTA